MPGPHLSQAECDHVRNMLLDRGPLQVCQEYGISRNTLHHLRKRNFKAVQRPQRPIPADWRDVAPGRSTLWLTRHYKAGWKVVDRWRKTDPVARRGAGNTPLPAPPDIADLIATMTAKAIAARCMVSDETAARWKREELARQAKAERARVAALSPLDRQIERIRNGARVVAKPDTRPASPAYSLVGNATGMF